MDCFETIRHYQRGQTRLAAPSEPGESIFDHEAYYWRMGAVMHAAVSAAGLDTHDGELFPIWRGGE